MTATESFSHTMSDADSLLWTISRDPVLRPTIVVVATLDRAPAWEQVRARFDELTMQFPQLRARAVPRPFGFWRPRWVADEHFDLDLHLMHQRAVSPRGFEESSTSPKRWLRAGSTPISLHGRRWWSRA